MRTRRPSVTSGGHSMALFGTLGYSRVLQGTPSLPADGCECDGRRLRPEGTLWYYLVLYGTLGYCRVLRVCRRTDANATASPHEGLDLASAAKLARPLSASVRAGISCETSKRADHQTDEQANESTSEQPSKQAHAQ